MEDIIQSFMVVEAFGYGLCHSSLPELSISIRKDILRISRTRYKFSTGNGIAKSRRRPSPRHRRSVIRLDNPIVCFITPTRKTGSPKRRPASSRANSASFILSTSLPDTPVPVRRPVSAPVFASSANTEAQLGLDLHLDSSTNPTPQAADVPLWPLPQVQGSSVQSPNTINHDPFISSPVLPGAVRRYTTPLPGMDVLKSMHERIKDAICNDLNKSSERYGSVYIFKDTRHIGVMPRLIFKYTSNKIARKSHLEEIYKRESVLHAFRAEQLCHAELKHYLTEGKKTYIMCKNLAMDTMNRWLKFVQKLPYDTNGKLLKKWRQSLEQMACPSHFENRLENHADRHTRWTKYIDSDGRLETNISEPETNDGMTCQSTTLVPEDGAVVCATESHAIPVSLIEEAQETINLSPHLNFIKLHSPWEIAIWITNVVAKISLAIAPHILQLLLSMINLVFSCLFQKSRQNSKSVDVKTAHKRLTKLIKKNLTRVEDHRDLQLYIFIDKKFEGPIERVKVGVTGDEKDKRRKNINSKSGAQFEEHKISDLIPNGRRAEQLCIKELDYFRDTTGSSREIFFVSVHVLEECRDRWIDFMNHEPYYKNGIRKGVLKGRWRRRLESINNHPNPEETVFDHSLRKERWRKFIDVSHLDPEFSGVAKPLFEAGDYVYAVHGILSNFWSTYYYYILVVVITMLTHVELQFPGITARTITFVFIFMLKLLIRTCYNMYHLHQTLSRTAKA
jgi:hypothetical protein